MFSFALGVYVGYIIFRYVFINCKAKSYYSSNKNANALLDKMDKCIKNQTDYNIQAIRSLVIGDIYTANLALEQSEEEAVKFDLLNKELNTLRNGK